MTWTPACGAVTRSTVTTLANGTGSGRRKATLLSCGYGNVPGCAGSWCPRRRCRNPRTLRPAVGDLRHDMTSATWTQAELLAFRETDAAGIRQKWAKEKEAKKMKVPYDLWEELAADLDGCHGYRTDVPCPELDEGLWQEPTGYHPWEDFMYSCDLESVCTYQQTLETPAEYEMRGWVRVDDAMTGVTIEERSANSLW